MCVWGPRPIRTNRKFRAAVHVGIFGKRESIAIHTPPDKSVYTFVLRNRSHVRHRRGGRRSLRKRFADRQLLFVVIIVTWRVPRRWLEGFFVSDIKITGTASGRPYCTDSRSTFTADTHARKREPSRLRTVSSWWSNTGADGLGKLIVTVGFSDNLDRRRRPFAISKNRPNRAAHAADSTGQRRSRWLGYNRTATAVNDDVRARKRYYRRPGSRAFDIFFYSYVFRSPRSRKSSRRTICARARAPFAVKYCARVGAV